MPPFHRAELDAHIAKSGKVIDPQSQGHSLPTGLQKAKTFLVDEYLEQIEATIVTFISSPFVTIVLEKMKHHTS